MTGGSPILVCVDLCFAGPTWLTFGNCESGKAEQVKTSLTYKPPSRFTISLTTNQTFARLPEGDFTADRAPPPLRTAQMEWKTALVSLTLQRGGMCHARPGK